MLVDQSIISAVDTRDAFFDQLYEIAKNDTRVIFLTADMGAHSLTRFKNDLPKQYINVGVAEQNMVNVAAGLSLSGKKVFIYSITPFTTFRCFEQIKINLSGMNLPVTVVGMGTGFTYSGDGPTHHAIHDIAVMRVLPGLTILNPADAVSTAWSAQKAYQSQGPVYVRIEKGKWPAIYNSADFDARMGMTLLREGPDVVLISSGIMAHKALEAAERLRERSLKAAVIDLFQVKPVNEKLLLSYISLSKAVVVLEENALTGGIGSAVCEILADAQKNIRVKRLGVSDEHCFTPGSREELQERYQLDIDGIVRAITNFIKQ